MVGWQVTATTVRCDQVQDEVTLLVYKDWSVRCTGYAKYAADKVRNRNGQSLHCRGTECQLANQYRKKLQEEESN